MSAGSLGFSAAEALVYLCASRCGRVRLNRALVGLTLLAGGVFGLVRLLSG